jgi:hypothetical protein
LLPLLFLPPTKRNPGLKLWQLLPGKMESIARISTLMETGMSPSALAQTTPCRGGAPPFWRRARECANGLPCSSQQES